MIRELKLIYDIWKWHNKTFDLTAQQQKQKLKSEIDEFNQAFKNFTKSAYPRRPKYQAKVNEELADVIIAGINCLKYPEIFERVAVKHNINTHRTWNGVHHNGK